MVSEHLSLKQAKLLRQHVYILKKLASSNNRDMDRRKILKNAPQELFQVLNIIFQLLANGQLELSKYRDRKLGKHKKLIRSASGLTGSHIKRKFSGRSGSALATVLSTVLPVIGKIIQSVF